MKLKPRFMENCEPFLKIGNNGIGLIFQHGSTGTPAAMRYASDYFFAKGYTVLAPALAGHATDVEDISRCTIDDYRTELEKAIFLLRSCCNRVILCGLSMGGILSAIVGSYMNLDGLVIMAAPSWNFQMSDAKTDCASRNPEDNGWYKPELMGEWKTYSMEEMIKRMPSGNGMQELLKLEKETVDEIQVPTLLIYSKGDKVCDWHQGEVIFDCIQAPKKEFCVLEHSGHVLTADGERDLVFQRIETFIEKHCNV